MSHEMYVLIVTAISIACLHTVTGPDHYLPFIVLSRTRQWSMARTVFWTILCGCAHVWSSVLLGIGGAAIGWSLSRIKVLENVRGGFASWALLGFGAVYACWGWLKASRNHSHKHFDFYEDGSIYVYEHRHGETVSPNVRHKVTPWVMFLIFALGPCEPMIPLLYFPAAKNSWIGMVSLIIVYTSCTLMTMLAMVIMGLYGVGLFKTAFLEKYMHFLGGLALMICGSAMIFMGW